MAYVNTNSFLDLYEASQKISSYRRLIKANVKIGDLFQLTKWQDNTESVNVEWKRILFKDFYCKVVGIGLNHNPGSIRIQVHSIADDSNLLKPNDDGTPAWADLELGSKPDIWFIFYSKLDLSRVNIAALDEDSLIPESLYT